MKEILKRHAPHRVWRSSTDDDTRG
jgi:hypothetical protein